MSDRRKMIGIPLVVLAVALGVNFGVGCAQRLNRPMESDAFYFYQLGASLAEGGGYVVRHGFWPDTPSLQRMPGWPGAVAAALRVAPAGLSDPAVMRALDLAINAACAAMLSLLTLSLFRRPGPALWAGLLYAFHPLALACADGGLSEPLFVLLAAAGAWLVYVGLPAASFERPLPPAGAGATLTGALLLGLACLVRSNFASWIFFFALGASWWGFRAGLWRRVQWWLLMGLAALLFVLPSTVWAVRNYRICGTFPVLSTLRGQTFYGGNNAVVAEGLPYWGYWVFPNNIPGETPLYDLSRTMSEYEVDTYYYAKGLTYLREHPTQIPWMMLGKLVRAYVPIPWVWSLGSIGVAGFRIALYVLAAVGLRRAWRLPAAPFQSIFWAMVLSNLLTVLTFYGYSRFAFTLEVFFIPFAGVAAADLCATVMRRLQPGFYGQQPA